MWRPDTPIPGWPMLRSKNPEEPTRHHGFRRKCMYYLFPDEYMRLRAFCSRRRSSISGLCRAVLLAYMDRMEARELEERRLKRVYRVEEQHLPLPLPEEEEE